MEQLKKQSLEFKHGESLNQILIIIGIGGAFTALFTDDEIVGIIAMGAAAVVFNFKPTRHLFLELINWFSSK